MGRAAVASRRIGTLAEKSLHAALKTWYAQPGDYLEWAVDGKHVVDIFRPASDGTAGECIEIQTRRLDRLKPKLARLLDQWPVRLVYPIAQERYIVRLRADGEIVSRRKSPKRGTIFHLFPELVSLPALVTHPNFTLDVPLIKEEEFWMDDGQGSWRRKHWSIYDRQLIEVYETISLRTPADFAALLPADLLGLFDTQALAEALGLPRALAQKMVYCLREMAVLEIAGRQGRSRQYRRSGEAPPG